MSPEANRISFNASVEKKMIIEFYGPKEKEELGVSQEYYELYLLVECYIKIIR